MIMDPGQNDHTYHRYVGENLSIIILYVNNTTYHTYLNIIRCSDYVAYSGRPGPIEADMSWTEIGNAHNYRAKCLYIYLVFSLIKTCYLGM